MKVLSSDLIPASTIVNADDITAYAGHPIENVQDSRLAKNAWLSAEGLSGDMYRQSMYNQNPYLDFKVTSSSIIDFDLLEIKDFDTFAIAGTNFLNYDITIEWAQGDINVPDGSFQYINDGPLWVAVSSLGAGIISARYVRITLSGIQTEDQYIQIGRISLGINSTIPDFGPRYDIEHISNARRSISTTRQLFGGPVVIYRLVNLTYPKVLTQEQLLTFFKDVDLYNPFYLQFPECYPSEPNMYVALAENALPFNYNDARLYTSRLSFMEVF